MTAQFPPEWVEAVSRAVPDGTPEVVLAAVVPLVRADEARRTAEEIRQSVIRLYTGNTRTDDDELGEYDCGVADAECIIAAVRDGLDPEREVIADVIANRATRAGQR